MKRLSIEDRFWSKVNKEGRLQPDGSRCWEWTGCTWSGKYGRFRIGNKCVFTHRMAWELLNGPIPPGYGWHGTVIRHIVCRNIICANPSHMTLGTQQQNVEDRQRDGTTARGDRSGSRTKPESRPRKISNDDVIAIRFIHSLNLYKQYHIADMFGISQSNLSLILNGKSRNNV